MSFLKPFGRFAGWWAAVASLYAATGGACPCCGAPGCPVGIGGAGVLGLFFAFIMNRLRPKIAGTPAEISSDEELSPVVGAGCN